jgi:magnesium and cobalt transporter
MSDDTHPSGDTGVSGWFQRLVQGRGDAKTREELAEFLAGFLERGIIGADEVAMLRGVLEVAGTQVRDIMVPRSQMVVVAKDQTPE